MSVTRLRTSSFWLLLATGLAMSASCGDSAKGGRGAAPNAELVAVAAANATAKEWVAGMLARDADKLATLCAPPIDEFLTAIATKGRVMTRAAAAMRAAFPEAADEVMLRQLDDNWHKPMSNLKGLRLVGRLTEVPQADRLVYRIAFLDNASWPVDDGTLEVSKIGGKWLVSSWGERYTPKSLHAGAVKTETASYAMSIDAFLNLLQNDKPKTARAAIEAWQNMLPTFENPNATGGK